MTESLLRLLPTLEHFSVLGYWDCFTHFTGRIAGVCWSSGAWHDHRHPDRFFSQLKACLIWAISSGLSWLALFWGMV